MLLLILNLEQGVTIFNLGQYHCVNINFVHRPCCQVFVCFVTCIFRVFQVLQFKKDVRSSLFEDFLKAIIVVRFFVSGENYIRSSQVRQFVSIGLVISCYWKKELTEHYILITVQPRSLFNTRLICDQTLPRNLIIFVDRLLGEQTTNLAHCRTHQ